LGLAYALHERAHIRVDALYLVLPKSLQILTNIFGITLLIGFAGIITWMAWGLVNDTLEFGSRSITPMRTPLAIPQLPWLFGWLFFVLTGTVILITALVRLLSGDLQGFDRLVGIKSIEDQIEDESTL
ncbi:MAG: TRAP transporter small permease subunit, partial [Paracoccaceae bacterium]